jgi:diacylglycerol kinase (ATP)
MAQVEPEAAQAPETIAYEPDTTTRKKKGVHKPIIAPFLSRPPQDTLRPARIHLFVNPFSGRRRRGAAVAADATRLLEAAGIEVVAYRSERAGHLLSLSAGAEVASDEEAFAVVGGDGSVCEVITGRLRNRKTLPRIAIIPCGTGNCQATELGITSVEAAVERILAGRIRKIDLAEVRVCDELWYSHNLVTWGLGVDSTVLAEKMRCLGPMRYDIGIVATILANRRRPATLTLDGKTLTGDYTLFLIQNTQTGGSNLLLAPGATADDGLMDIGVLRRMCRRSLIKAFGMLKSEGRHVFHPRVAYHRFKSLALETPVPMKINVDGEIVGTTPLQMTVLPRALAVFA